MPYFIPYPQGAFTDHIVDLVKCSGLFGNFRTSRNFGGCSIRHFFQAIRCQSSFAEIDVVTRPGKFDVHWQYPWLIHAYSLSPTYFINDFLSNLNFIVMASFPPGCPGVLPWTPWDSLFPMASSSDVSEFSLQPTREFVGRNRREKTNLWLSIESWLFHRDPYNGLWNNPYITGWYSIIPYIP